MSDELARRAAACDAWRWMPGMAFDAYWNDDGPMRVASAGLISECAASVVGAAGIDHITHEDMASALPDLTDPATLGCLLALVRDAWGEPSLSPMLAPGGDGSEWIVPAVRGAIWRRWADMDDAVGLSKSYTELLVTALEAASNSNATRSNAERP